MAVSGIKWTMVSTITITVVNLAKISVLARFLEKSEFGLMALVTFVLGFMDLFMDMGLASAILHKQNITKNEYASLYWINVIFSLAVFGLIWMVSPLVANFYNESELAVLIPLMGISIILSAIGRQYRVIEQKELNFKIISLVDIFSSASGLVVSIILAVKGYGVYSLVFGSLTMYALSNLFFSIRGIFKKGLLLHFNYNETKPFLKIGIFQVGGQIVNYFNRDLDILIIGKFFGTELLGGYSLAKQLVRRPFQIINPIFNRVGVSVFPRYQNDNTALRKYTSKILLLLGGVNGLIYGLIAILAAPLVLVLYGVGYLNITIFVQLFAGLTYLRSMGNLVGILVITKGRTDLDFYWNLLTLIIFPTVIIVGSIFSLEIIIIFMFGAQLVLLIPGWHMFYRSLIQMKLALYLRPILLPLVIVVPFVFLSYMFDNIIIMSLCSILLSTFIIFYLFKNSEDVRFFLNKIKKYIPGFS
jgi:O-antigen/teichoic acid export membrane protein